MAVTVAVAALAQVSEPIGGTTAGLFVAAAILVIVAYGLVWLGYLAVRYERREWMVRLFDPNSYPNGSLWEAIIEMAGARAADIQTPARAIVSATRTYRISKPLGVGDVCDVHLATSRRGEFALKVSRVGGCDRLLEKEQMILRELQKASRGDVYGDYFPIPVETFRADDRLVSVLEYRRGYLPATEIRERFPAGLDPRHLAWMFNRTLEALGFVHRLGWVHGAVLPPHLTFDCRNHGLQLIGWIHAKRVHTPLDFASRTYASWYPPECHQRKEAMPATDIHLAAKSILWLAGGDPLSDEPTDRLPIEFGCFLHKCLTAPESHRQDAWAVHEQFRELLEDLYGPPKFCHLNLS